MTLTCNGGQWWGRLGLPNLPLCGQASLLPYLPVAGRRQPAMRNSLLTPFPVAVALPALCPTFSLCPPSPSQTELPSLSEPARALRRGNSPCLLIPRAGGGCVWVDVDHNHACW